MSLVYHEPSPLVVTCSQCSKRHEQKIFSTVPQRLNFCSMLCLELYSSPKS